ncbi:sterol desaturase family protein [Acinetobacter sp. MD2]|uniref:sterol desaturase family protein n=1 Tax=Acinetobacter sp. MD2 TaxID=2600066 RepID=UPI002D1F68B8|nr:sterol desaturase family protein [Acinetobacter sp. MD2]MEB3766850.1 sterol desaturase family protein [Acinetobacter sp. MD2]
MQLAAPLMILLVLILLEAFILQRVKKQQVNWQDIIFNLNSGHIVLWLFRGLEIICFNFVYTHFSLDLFQNLPVVIIWIFAIFAWDLGFYWLHRLHHKIPLFWAVHVVHHQGEHFNLSLAMRNSWYSSLTSIPFFMFMAILGVPTYMFVVVSMLHYSVQFFNHNAVTPKLGFLEKILVTPAHHRIHHVKDKFYSNHNFGGTFIFWDKLFGSFQAALPQKPFCYGSYGVASSNPFLANNIPFFQLFKLPFRTPKLNEKYRLSDVHFSTGGFLLFTLTICYIYTYGYGYNNVGVQQYALFSYLVLGTIALGAIAEGRIWGIYSWFLLTCSAVFVFLGMWSWSQWYWQLFLCLAAAHGLMTLIKWLILSKKIHEIV